jgi:hypothetical protein
MHISCSFQLVYILINDAKTESDGTVCVFWGRGSSIHVCTRFFLYAEHTKSPGLQEFAYLAKHRKL